jgi:DNA polymerase-3 subunit alpha
MGLTVLVPDINRSQSDFVPARLEGGEVVIPFGLSAVRNVGAGLVSHLLAERDANGPFVDFYDFCSRVDATVLNKRAIESLIKAGAFDSLGHPRKGMLVVFEQIVDQALARRREEEKGVMSLFDDLGGTEETPLFDERVPIPPLDFDKKEKLAFEKEMLGLYVSDHPLMGAEDALRRRTDGTIEELAELSDGTSRIVGGVVTGLQRKYTKKGDLMAVFTLEDLRSTIEVMVFPKTMTSIGHLLADDAVVIVRGRVDKRDETPKLIAVDVTVFDGIVDGAPPLRIKVRPERLDERSIGKLKALLSEFPGESRVFLHLDDRQVLRLPVAHCVETGTALSAELRVMFGPDAIIG